MKKMLAYLLPITLLGSFMSSLNVSAAAKSVDENISRDRNMTTVLFDAVTGVAPQKQNTIQNKNSSEVSDKANYAGRHFKHDRMAGPSSMFRRVVNAPGAGGSRYSASRDAPEVASKHIITLKATLPPGFSSKDVEWFVKATNGSSAKKAKGNGSKVSLAPGKYKITMKVGGSSVVKTVTVGSQAKTVPFALKAGKLKASATFSGGIKEKVSFDVYRLSNGKRQGKAYSVSKAFSISRAFPPGQYEIVTKGGGTSATKRITLQSGKTKVAKLVLPATKVKLMAKDANAQPYMGKTSWQIFRAGSSQPIKTANRHIADVKLPAGRYVVKGKTENGSWKMQKFTVSPGATKYVKLKVE